ncbi:hypothetical protein MPTK2_7g09300 [Marchantia polymorpha subsp. ruderalis]
MNPSCSTCTNAILRKGTAVLWGVLDLLLDGWVHIPARTAPAFTVCNRSTTMTRKLSSTAGSRAPVVKSSAFPYSCRF